MLPQRHTCAWIHCHIQTSHSITDELLAAHDKSPPVCGISVVVHVRARPDPTASALSPTTWGPAWMTAWLTNGRISSDKKHWWLITVSPEHLREAWCAKDCEAQESASIVGLSTWLPGADSPARGSVWSSPQLFVHSASQQHNLNVKQIQYACRSGKWSKQ